MKISDEKPCMENEETDDLFSAFPEGTKIFIQGNSVTFENMTPDMLEIAQTLNPDDDQLKRRKSTVKP